MGYGQYSLEAHQQIVSKRQGQSQKEIFSQRQVHPLMNPKGVKFRESRDSPDHPNSVPIVFALDVTGSMGKIPELLARTELPKFMSMLMDGGLPDPQVLFMAVGDATSDQGPLQVGQFESTAESMDSWLTMSWLEGGGGGNGYESYDLALYFAARHTYTDSVAKRGKRGYFFLTGDEKPFPAVSRLLVEQLVGDDLPDDIPMEQICAELSGLYHGFFLVPTPKRRQYCEEQWRELFHDHVICLEDPSDTCYAAAALVSLCEGLVPDLDAAARAFEQAGLGRHRVAGLVTALTPFASVLGRDGGLDLEPISFPPAP